MISGSLRLRGVTLRFPSIVTPAPVASPAPTEPLMAAVEAPVPTPAETQPEAVPASPESTQSTGTMFVWAVSGSDLGTHKLGDRLATTLSATYQGTKVQDYTITAGALPDSISLNPTSGILLGTLTSSGTFVFTIRARYDVDVSDATYSLVVA